MGALEDHYRGQSSHDAYVAEVESLHAEASERGLTIREVAAERRAAALDYRKAEQARIDAMVNDPQMLHAIRAHFAPRSALPDGTYPEPPPLPTWSPAAAPPLPPPPASSPVRTGPPSSGRSVPNQRLPSRSGSAAQNDLAAALIRARGRV